KLRAGRPEERKPAGDDGRFLPVLNTRKEAAALLASDPGGSTIYSAEDYHRRPAESVLSKGIDDAVIAAPVVDAFPRFRDTPENTGLHGARAERLDLRHRARQRAYSAGGFSGRGDVKAADDQR